MPLISPLFEVLLETRDKLSVVIPMEDVLLDRMKLGGGTPSSFVDTLRFMDPPGPLPWVCVRERFRGLELEGDEGGFSAIPLLVFTLLPLDDAAGGEKRDILLRVSAAAGRASANPYENCATAQPADCKLQVPESMLQNAV